MATKATGGVRAAAKDRAHDYVKAQGARQSPRHQLEPTRTALRRALMASVAAHSIGRPCGGPSAIGAAGTNDPEASGCLARRNRRGRHDRGHPQESNSAKLT